MNNNNIDVAREVARLILNAIEKGAPAFNKGSSDRCLTLYKDALENSIKKLEKYKDTDYLGTILKDFGSCSKKVASIPEDDDEKACWEVRKSFDSALEILKTKSGLKFRNNPNKSTDSGTPVDPQRVSQRTSVKLHSGANQIDELGLKEIRQRMETGKNSIKLKKHGGLLKSFKDSFTGADGISWIKSELKLQDKICIEVFQKLLDKKFIVSCSDKHNKFKDKDIYKFQPVKISESEQKQLEKEEKLLTSGQEHAQFILEDEPTPVPTPNSTPKNPEKDPDNNKDSKDNNNNNNNNSSSPAKPPTEKPKNSKEEQGNTKTPSKDKPKPKVYSNRLEPEAQPETFDCKSPALQIVALNVCKWIPFITTDSQKRKGGWILDLRLVCKDFNHAICSRTFLNFWLPNDQKDIKDKINNSFHAVTLSGSELLCLLIKENGRLEKKEKEPQKKKAFTRNNNADKDESYEQATWVIAQQNNLYGLRRFGKGAIPVPKSNRTPKQSEYEIFTNKK